MHKDFPGSAHQNMVAFRMSDQVVGGWLWAEESYLEPQWLHTLLTSSRVTWNSYISINHKASRNSPRSQEDWKSAPFTSCRNSCCRNSSKWASSRSRSRLWGWLLLFLFISLFLWELSWVSEAEQKHTNRMAENDKNLSAFKSQYKYIPSLFDQFIVSLPEACVAYSMYFLD